MAGRGIEAFACACGHWLEGRVDNLRNWRYGCEECGKLYCSKKCHERHFETCGFLGKNQYGDEVEE